MKNLRMIPLALLALYACADNTPTEPLPRAPSLRPLLGAFPGNNGRFVFVSNQDANIYTMNADGSDRQLLTTRGFGPTWNAAGTKVVFHAQTGVDDHNEIFVVNADGSGRTQLTFNSVAPGLTFPSWSPDGSKIVFQNNFDGKIYVMNSDGTNAAALTSSGFDALASWSPDGSKIAFSSWRDNFAAPEIYVMNADGTNQTRLTNNLVPDYDPSWSPDGSKIAFSHEASNSGGWADVYVMNANGTGATNLTNTANLGESSTVWSPDGTKIGYIRGDGASTEVFVMNAADGTAQTNITRTSAGELHLDWQPTPVCVFGPRVYTRLQGAPQRFTETIEATPGSYTVDLDDLATSGADATVTLNGVVIMEGRGTTGEVGPRHKTVTVTLLETNTLDINLRGKKGSKLQVKICPASGSQCYPNLPAPTLSLQSTTVEGSMARFELDVANYAQFPAELFVQSPNLPACGLNTSASRTWVDIYDGSDAFLFGFCSLGSPSDLNHIWFATPDAQRPAEAYIKVTDRLCNITYTSNRITIPGSQ